MKKKSLTVFIILSMVVVSRAQDFCLMDRTQNKVESTEIPLAKNGQKIEEKSLKLNVENFLTSRGISINNSSKYEGIIYTIPIVVHILVPNEEATGTPFNPSDVTIQTWIENCNKIFATTYGGIFYPEGEGEFGGTVMPFKLVLAQRTEYCEATTGIIRYYNVSKKFPEYETGGVKEAIKGVSKAEVKSFIPHWSEMAYFNIYLVKGFDGQFDGGLVGAAGYAEGYDSDYDSFMTCRVASNVNSGDVRILPHEMGHAFGIMHTFGRNYDTKSDLCPDLETNENCSTVSDNVCDTAPVKPFLKPLPDNTIVNPCTNKFYDGTQYNIMSYNAERKFTPGQRDRAIAMMLKYRESLTQSLSTTPIDASSESEKPIVASSAVIVASNPQNRWNGPTLVQLGTINNVTKPRIPDSHPYSYIDYSTKNCIVPTVYTDLLLGKSYPLNIGIVGAKEAYTSQFINVWIDYNNSSTFENEELVASSGIAIVPTKGFYDSHIWSTTITIPLNATLDTPLRMRVKADGIKGDFNAVNNGQIEDYTVTLRSSLEIKNQTSTSTKFIVWYSKSENKLISNTSIGTYKIYDSSGKVIQEGVSNTKEVILDFNQSGTYIIKSTTINTKFIK